jgi:hypothetical protein
MYMMHSCCYLPSFETGQTFPSFPVAACLPLKQARPSLLFLLQPATLETGQTIPSCPVATCLPLKQARPSLQFMMQPAFL